MVDSGGKDVSVSLTRHDRLIRGLTRGDQELYYCHLVECRGESLFPASLSLPRPHNTSLSQRLLSDIPNLPWHECGYKAICITMKVCSAATATCELGANGNFLKYLRGRGVQMRTSPHRFVHTGLAVVVRPYSPHGKARNLTTYLKLLLS